MFSTLTDEELACQKDSLISEDGRGGGIRTHDPLLPKQMRYQAALRPDLTLLA